MVFIWILLSYNRFLNIIAYLVSGYKTLFI